ncbi:MAG: hypothetical protein KGN02_05935 [bacterium]|nr:hypothetical protein [bacterium]
MKKKRSVAKGRMTQAHISAVVAEIEAYDRGEREGALSWSHLEKFSGFSHVALWQKEPIKNAFQRVKQRARRDATPAIKPHRTVDKRISSMQEAIDELRELIRAYDEQWALYEHNLHRLGLDPEELRRPLDRLSRREVRGPGRSDSTW